MREQANLAADVDRLGPAALAAGEAWRRLSAGERAAMLDAVADALDARRADVLSACAAETSLTEAELTPEATRMSGTLRLLAGVVREGSWVRAAIDTADAPAPVGPPHDVRSMLMPLGGAVAVFGASNFPLAYGVCGGDTASALAAGSAVIVKEHPAHPRTGRLIFSIVSDAIRRALPEAGDVLGYLTHEDAADLEPSRRLVWHPAIAAVGFTGSVGGGLAVESLARTRPRPLPPAPVFGELGSLNPVHVGSAAARARGEVIADELCDSIFTRHGQQCTKPGVVFIPHEAWDRVAERFAWRFGRAPARRMLAPWIRESYLARLREAAGTQGVRALVAGDAHDPASAVGVTLLACDAAVFARSPALHEEIFGPACLLVRLPAGVPAGEAPPLLNGSLTASFYADEDDASGLLAGLRRRPPAAGRLIVNGVPTGVRVAHGMVHGGPFPSSTRPDTTAVGPGAMARWCRPVCFQNAPDGALPAALRNANPLGIERLVNGRSTRGPVAG